MLTPYAAGKEVWGHPPFLYNKHMQATRLLNCVTQIIAEILHEQLSQNLFLQIYKSTIPMSPPEHFPSQTAITQLSLLFNIQYFRCVCYLDPVDKEPSGGFELEGQTCVKYNKLKLVSCIKALLCKTHCVEARSWRDTLEPCKHRSIKTRLGY